MSGVRWIVTLIEGNVLERNGYGIRISGGATDSLIRDNTIAYNRQDGVRIKGMGTEKHRITGNSITANGGRGIDNQEGGNAELEPPKIVSVAGGTVLGLAQPGEIVELYNDLFF